MANDADKKSSRYRFSVPNKDETVLRWVEQQSNLSVSLRMLIRWAIQEYGYADVTCLSVKRGRGRPSNTAEDVQYERGPEAYEAPRPAASVASPVMPVASQSSVKPVQAPAAAPVPKPVQVKEEPVRHIPGVDDLLL